MKPTVVRSPAVSSPVASSPFVSSPVVSVHRSAPRNHASLSSCLQQSPPVLHQVGSLGTAMTPLRLAMALRRNPVWNLIGIPTPERRARRRSEQLTEDEKWICPNGCGKFYKLTSSRSIQKHQKGCSATGSSEKKEDSKFACPKLPKSKRCRFSKYLSKLKLLRRFRARANTMKPTSSRARTKATVLFPSLRADMEPDSPKVENTGSLSGRKRDKVQNTSIAMAVPISSSTEASKQDIQGLQHPLSDVWSKVTNFYGFRPDSLFGNTMNLKKRGWQSMGAYFKYGLQKRRRKAYELAESERWYCSFGCGKFYRRTSSKSISAHKKNCMQNKSKGMAKSMEKDLSEAGGRSLAVSKGEANETCAPSHSDVISLDSKHVAVVPASEKTIEKERKRLNSKMESAAVYREEFEECTSFDRIPEKSNTPKDSHTIHTSSTHSHESCNLNHGVQNMDLSNLDLPGLFLTDDDAKDLFSDSNDWIL